MSGTAIKIKQNLAEYSLPEPQALELANLLKVCSDHIDNVDTDLISRAFKLSFLMHDGETRASGEPYYMHPLEVAYIIAREIGMDDVSIVAALLHDTVEDTSVSLDDIKKEFGPTVSHLIDGLTKISGVFKTKGTKQAETFMKLLITMAEDLRVVLIKFADRLHNMRTLYHLPKAKQLTIATETMELYAPLAHRFGLFKIKSELEDLSFKALDPNGFKFIARKLKERKESRETFMHQFMEPIHEKLISGGFDFEIKGRPKHIYSIYKKMMRQQKPFEEIYDLFAIRIILNEPHSKEDCWRVYSIITDSYTPIPERFRDFISVPKANGYQSLHTTLITNRGVKVEVQIRTHKMDEIAEKGLAAHWKYKEGHDKTTIDKFVNWVREVLENPRPEAATEFVEDFQLNLYTDEIYVFTPKGELKTLPNGSTPIDFAFDIHSEVGERALAAKVNGKIMPLRHKLKSGDQVEIITGKQVNLNPDWINDVATHKAKSRIRQFIKQKERRIYDIGRELWDKRAEKNKINVNDQDLMKIASMVNYESLHRLFVDIGTGVYDINKFLKAVKSYQSKGRIDEEKLARIPGMGDDEAKEHFLDDARTHRTGQGLVLNGLLADVKYTYSRCCNPIPGDDVVGFISRDGEVKVHRTSCKNLKHLIKNDAERIIDVSWAKNTESQFIGAVKLIGEDRVGLINDISNVISNTLKTNMKSINVNSDSGSFEGTLIIFVDNIKHLEKVIKRIQKIDGIKQVYRYE
ncbi:MAG: bifunctional (p)ppGpp synthetase/guanosine-3',5'-bis(diphosphate) 3'-pyrophosphohydrolase [Balneolaceae bacterium]|nr:MAG: bifunctional (p)ppGpp synthetase/guanosine-3',5'-bis(diphosphate) 3'-pyrophosphohydrolase [Balneolaceae bacterium]